MKKIFIWLIKGYKIFLSPLLPPSCRFRPTCSQYAIEAIERFGIFRGTWLGIKRILRCNPFFPGGYDPVPPLSMDTKNFSQVIQTRIENSEDTKKDTQKDIQKDVNQE